MSGPLLQNNVIVIGAIASVLTGLSTGVGALPIFIKSDISRKGLDAALGVAAGVMLAATSFSLIIPAIEKGGGNVRGALVTLVGILAGGVFLDITDTLFPGSNLMVNYMGDGGASYGARLRKIWLFIAAITIHNFPEGLAVGVGFAEGDIANGLTLAIAIGLQNLPEGLAVALPLLREKYPKWKAFLIALATGIVEPLGGLLSISVAQLSRQLLPFAMAFAAGAMLFVISHEIIPETQSNRSHSRLATHALLVGFVVMMFLDTALR